MKINKIREMSSPDLEKELGELKNIEMGRKEEKDISDRLRKMVGICI